MRVRCAAAGLGLAAVALAGCAGREAPAVSPGEAARVSSESAEPGRRQLFRVTYQGPGGNGSMRLALLETGTSTYQARASDAFGRALWSLELGAAGATFVDHRRERYCLSGRDLRIPELALGSLALDRLPSVLSGEVPAASSASAAGASDFVDSEGRRWTVARGEAAIEAWTLWTEGRPLLWWKRQEQGGVLSHRDGAQFRWRRSVAERSMGSVPPLAVPESYGAVECDELSPVPDRR